jgi:DNA-binding CsgD family transcriptional regulator
MGMRGSDSFKQVLKTAQGIAQLDGRMDDTRKRLLADWCRMVGQRIAGREIPKAPDRSNIDVLSDGNKSVTLPPPTHTDQPIAAQRYLNNPAKNALQRPSRHPASMLPPNQSTSVSEVSPEIAVLAPVPNASLLDIAITKQNALQKDVQGSDLQRPVRSVSPAVSGEISPIVQPTAVHPQERVDPLSGVKMSPRMRQILQRLLSGDSEKQIAARLSISPHTVHTYVKRLHKTLGVASRGELLARFVQM